MSQIHTLQVKFDESPQYSARMDVLGGQLEGVAFVDQFAKNEEAGEKLSKLRELIDDGFVTADPDSEREAEQLFDEIAALI